VTEAYCRRVVRGIPEGWSELYFHPGAEHAGVAPERLAEMIDGTGIQLSDSVSLAMEKGVRAAEQPAAVSSVD
jgi:hypothetical protein